jgi:hypothetical protein
MAIRNKPQNECARHVKIYAIIYSWIARKLFELECSNLILR